MSTAFELIIEEGVMGIQKLDFRDFMVFWEDIFKTFPRECLRGLSRKFEEDESKQIVIPQGAMWACVVNYCEKYDLEETPFMRNTVIEGVITLFINHACRLDIPATLHQDFAKLFLKTVKDYDIKI